MVAKTRRTTKPYVPPIEDFDSAKEHKNLFVYSDYGVGKTVFAASHPNSLLLAVDRGTISAARQSNSGKGKLWRIGDWPDFEAAQKWIRAGGYRQYEWLVVDSASMLRERCMRFRLETEHERNKQRDEFVPAQPDHQHVQNVMKRVAETFCDLPVNLLFTAFPMRIESRDGEEHVLPMIHGQNGDTAHYIAGLFDSVGYMEVVRKQLRTDEEGEPTGRKIRRIHWEPYNEYTGKDRFDVLGPHTDDLTLPEIDALIDGTGQRSTTATTTRRRATRTRRTA